MDPERWLTDHGDVLFRYALIHTNRRDVAEDLVQETLLAAWRGREGFRAAANIRTWLVGILKHKVQDHFRHEARNGTVTSHSPEGEEDPEIDAMFQSDGHWRFMPGAWGRDPLAEVEVGEFWTVLNRCIELLPERLRDSFLAREFGELDSPGICELLKITETNLYVLLHRARLRIRECVERNWFDTKG